MLKVIINGNAQSGKDTFVKFVQEALGVGVINLSTIDPVKAAAKVLGWNGTKDEKSRQFLSDLKDAWSTFNQGSFHYIVNEIEKIQVQLAYSPVILDLDLPVAFIHCREPEEIQMFRKHYGKKCITLLMRRPGLVVPGNHADTDVEQFDYDVVINNDGTLDALREQAMAFAVTQVS